MKIFIFNVLILLSTIVNAQSPVGYWKTIDDKTGEAKSMVKIFESKGKLYATIEKFLRPGADLNKKCVDCEGTRKNQNILGMIFVENLVKIGDKWKNGTIIDPENGKTYDCTIWFDPSNTDILKVRGYHWTGLYRTQTWQKVK
jgi:uncharacterized protein (DUF2147 family)